MAPNVVAAELLLSLVFCLLVVIASHPPTASAGSAALLVYLAADGRRGVRRSHEAARSQDWWNRCVPAMHDEVFERTFRVSRTVFPDATGKALRLRVYESMRMAEWEPTRQEEVNRKERARRAASRSNKEDI